MRNKENLKNGIALNRRKGEKGRRLEECNIGGDEVTSIVWTITPIPFLKVRVIEEDAVYGLGEKLVSPRGQIMNQTSATKDMKGKKIKTGGGGV